MNPVAVTLTQVLVIAALAPAASGLATFLKARLQGRHGAVPWLPYQTLLALLQKENVLPTAHSWLFRAAPYVVLGASIFLTIVLPLVGTGGVFATLSNFIVVAAVLALGSAFLVLGGLDAGSAYGGLGASRHMTIISLLQPTIILTFVTFALASGASTIDGMIADGAVRNATIMSAPYLILSVFALMLIAVAENARYPVDDHASNEEIATIQGALFLDYSGPYLAMLEYASALKLTMFALLVANIVLPWPLISASSTIFGVVLTLFTTIVKVSLAMFAVAVMESTIANMRFYRVQEFLTSAFFLALTGLTLALLSQLL